MHYALVFYPEVDRLLVDDIRRRHPSPGSDPRRSTRVGNGWEAELPQDIAVQRGAPVPSPSGQFARKHRSPLVCCLACLELAMVVGFVVVAL